MSTSLHLANLPFVESKEGAIVCLWKVSPTGEWEKDCEMGRVYANSYLEYLMMPDASPGSLNQIVKAMPRHKMGGIECGFWQYLAGRLML